MPRNGAETLTQLTEGTGEMALAFRSTTRYTVVRFRSCTVTLPAMHATLARKVAGEAASQQTRAIFCVGDNAALPSKQGVAGSSPVSRSDRSNPGAVTPGFSVVYLPAPFGRSVLPAC